MLCFLSQGPKGAKDLESHGDSMGKHFRSEHFTLGCLCSVQKCLLQGSKCVVVFPLSEASCHLELSTHGEIVVLYLLNFQHLPVSLNIGTLTMGVPI